LKRREHPDLEELSHVLSRPPFEHGALVDGLERLAARAGGAEKVEEERAQEGGFRLEMLVL